MSETSIERLTNIGLSDGEAALSWFGQASFAARGGGTTVLLDPFLSPYDGRLHDSPLAPDECVGIDVVFCSHEHVDHLDVPSIDAIATASPGAVFVVPSPIVDMVTEAGVPSGPRGRDAARRPHGDRRPDRPRGPRVPRRDDGRRVRVRRDACPTDSCGSSGS